MRWDIRRVYLYLVSLITLIMLLVGGSMFVNGAVDLIVPPPGYDQCTMTPEKASDVATCDNQQRADAKRQVAYRKRDLIRYGIFLGMVFPVYLYHWRRARRTDGPGSTDTTQD